jgi:hypothetical protein
MIQIQVIGFLVDYIHYLIFRIVDDFVRLFDENHFQVVLEDKNRNKKLDLEKI